MGLLDSRLHRKLHQRSGESLRWFKAIPVPAGAAGARSDGVRLVEQTLPAEARFLVGNTEEKEDNTPFGSIAKGTVQVSAFPDWARFNRQDRIVLTAPGRLLSTVAKKVTRGEGEEDALPLPHVASIVQVWISGEVVGAASYEAMDTGIKWLEDAPEAGTVYSVEYLYAPRYEVLPQSHRTSPTDKNGISFPLRYWLQREQNT